MYGRRTFFDNNRIIALILSPLIAILYSIVASSLVNAPLLSLFLVNTVTIYLILSNLEMIKTPSSRLIFIIVSALKLVLVLINAQYKSVPFTGTDWSNYDAMARSTIENSATIIDMYNNSFDLFVFVVSCIYSVFGENINQIFFYMIPFSFLTFRYVYKTVIMITKNEKRASIAGLLVLTWPANLVFSVSVLRESFIQLLVAVSFYNFVRYIKKGYGLLIGYLFGIFASLTHSGLIAVPLTYTYMVLQRQGNKAYRVFSVWSIVITGLVLALVMFTPFWGSIGKQFGNIHSADDITGTLEVKGAALSDANTSYIDSSSESIGSLLLSFPYRLTMFVFSPFLWQVRDGGTAIAFIVDSIPTLLLITSFIIIFKNRKWFSRSNQNIIVSAMVCVVVTFTIFSLGTNNYGTAMRHRTKILPIAIVTVTAFGSIYGAHFSTNRALVRSSKDDVGGLPK